MSKQQPTLDQLFAMRGSPVVDPQGEEIGKVDQVYFDEESNAPRWVEITSGFLGMKRALVPLDGAEIRDVELHVPFGKEQVQDAPEPEEIKALSPASERELAGYYGLDERAARAQPEPTVVRVMRVWLWPDNGARAAS